MKISNNPKVLMLAVSYGKFGGTELGAQRLRNWLVDNGVDVTVIAAGSSNDIIKVPTFGVWRIFWPIFAYIISVTYVLMHSIDVIYARFATYPLFVGVVLKYISRKPLIVSIHGGDIRHNGLFGRIVTYFMKKADHVVCYGNDGHIAELRRRGIEPIVIDNGVDTRLYVLKKDKNAVKKVIYLGGTREIKGWFDINAIVNSNKFSDLGGFEFNVYGDGSIKSTNIVKYFDRVPHDKIKDIYETGQLFILPSRAEGVPGAMLEAMASGMYVIASDLDFTRKVLDKKFLFTPGDTDGAINLILKFYNEKKEYFADQNRANRKMVVENYSLKKMGEKWKELILRVKND